MLSQSCTEVRKVLSRSRRPAIYDTILTTRQRSQNAIHFRASRFGMGLWISRSCRSYLTPLTTPNPLTLFATETARQFPRSPDELYGVHARRIVTNNLRAPHRRCTRTPHGERHNGHAVSGIRAYFHFPRMEFAARRPSQQDLC